jgi:hypothetical protein
MIRTSRIGIITPEGDVYKWSEILKVELEVKATIRLPIGPKGKEFTMGAEWEGDSAREVLLDLLDATCDPPEGRMQ